MRMESLHSSAPQAAEKYAAKAFNRMNDEIPTCSMTGEIEWDGKNLLSEDVDPVLLRKRFRWCSKRMYSHIDLKMSHLV